MGLFGLSLATLTLEPLFGPKAWGKDSTCHDVHPNGPIPAKDRVCCMACHKTGVEGHPRLKETADGLVRLSAWEPDGGRDPWSDRDAPAAEPTRFEPSTPAAELTRKQKRDIKFGREPRLDYMDPDRLGFLVDGGKAVPFKSPD